MSGFEIVGVVLGAIPLIISAIEMYKKTSRRLKFVHQKEALINELVRSLHEQHCFIRSDLSLTLKATFLEDKDIEALLHQPSSDLFRDQEIECEVQEYLGDGYKPYVAALARCEQILMEVAQSLSGLTPNSQATLSSLVQANTRRNGMYEFTRRIKFSIAKDDIERQIKELDKTTINLERIRRYGKSLIEVTFPPTSRTVSKITSSFDTVAEHARRLYSAIALGYTGNCHSEHEAQLFLQHRAELLKKPRALKGIPLAFTVAFGPAMPGSCFKAEVKVMEEGVTSCMDGHNDNNLSDTQRNPNPVVAANARPPGIGRPRVSFQLPERRVSQHELNFIINLCQHFSSESLLELHLSKGGNLCHYSTSSGTDTIRGINPNFADLTSLEKLLQPKRLSLRQRMTLALSAVSSVMQLSLTPWLDLPLTSEVVYLVPEDSSMTPATLQPFIRQRFIANATGKPPHNNIRQTMLELGILLLELWQEQTLGCFAAENKIPINTPAARYHAACEWVSLSMEHIIPFYFDAARRCIECNFATSPKSSANFDWKDPVFRKSVCEHILRPLLEECRA